MCLDRNFSIAAFLRLRRELAFITGDIGAARCNKFHQFSLASGHWLALRFQTFVTLPRGRNRESQIVQSLKRLFFLSSRALFVGLGGALCSFLLRKFNAPSIQFAFEFGDAFAGGLDLLLESFLFGLETIDLAFGFFFFGLEQRNFVGGSRMRQMGALILRASFVQLARSSFDIRFRLIAFLDENLALVRGLGLFSFQRGYAHFAFEQRVGFHSAAPAENNSLHRDEFAVERCHREGGFIFLAGEGLVEFGENEDAAEQLANHRLNCTRCDDFINGPGQRTFGQTLADGFVSRSAKLRNKQRGLPELLFRQPPENFFGAARVLQYHRVQIPTQRRFDRGNKSRIDVDLRDERTNDRFSKALWVVQALENCPRTLGQSFALGIKLTQNLEGRSPFGESALQRRELVFRSFEKLLLLAQILFRCL